MPTLIALIAALAATPPNCEAFEASVSQPAAVSFQAISGERLGAALVEPAQSGNPARFKVGDLIYQGYGVAIQSSDPRFAALVMDPAMGARHPCGNVLSALSGWNAHDASDRAWTLTFRSKKVVSMPPPGALVAAEAGSKPVLAGHQAGSTWPVFVGRSRYFLGLMYPDDGRRETVLVAFADRPGGNPARIVARLPERLEAMSVVPDLHSANDYINLEGLAADHALLRITLAFPEPVRRSLAEALSVGS